MAIYILVIGNSGNTMLEGGECGKRGGEEICPRKDAKKRGRMKRGGGGSGQCRSPVGRGREGLILKTGRVLQEVTEAAENEGFRVNVRRRWAQIVDRWETWWWVFSAGRCELLARFCQEVPALPGMVGELGGARADAGGGEQSLAAASIDHRMLGKTRSC